MHDVIEDCGVSYCAIYKKFGRPVADAVDGLTERSRPDDGNRAKRKRIDAEWYSQQDPIVQTIKILDMISNSKSIKEHDARFWKTYRKEKLELIGMLKLADKRALSRAIEIIN